VDDPTIVVDALGRVVAGECVIDPGLVGRLLRPAASSWPLEGLTPRELDVLALMAEGRSNTAIAGSWGLSLKTLDAHSRRILQRLGLDESLDDHRRVLAVLQYLRFPR
jgi:DNA-binding NarL/FixJ family response regulator